MTTLTLKITRQKDWEILKPLLDRLEIEYDLSDSKPYKTGFVAKIKRGEEDILKGNTKKIDLDDIWK